MLLSLLKTLLLPPALPLLLMLAGLILLARMRRLAITLILFSATGLYLLSTPYIAVNLAQILEQSVEVLNLESPKDSVPELLIVLGGGRRINAVEYEGSDRPSPRAMERLLYGAALARRTNIPLMISGGRVLPGEHDSEAQLMSAVLENELQVPVKWQESASRTTWENAMNSRALLPVSIQKVALVTHAMHMQRAVFAFELAGFDVTPAPTGFHQLNNYLPFWAQWLPDSRHLTLSRDVLHEWLGLAWYRLRASRLKPDLEAE